MGKVVDRTGKQYGDWLVLSPAFIKHHRQYWNCICQPKNRTCGTERAVDGYNLQNGKSSNCGCRRSIVARKNMIMNFHNGQYIECQYSKKALRDLYERKLLSTTAIAKIARLSHENDAITDRIINRWLRNYNIPLRPKREALKIFVRQNPEWLERLHELSHAEFRIRLSNGWRSPYNFRANPDHHKRCSGLAYKANARKWSAVRAQREREAAEKQAAKAIMDQAIKHGTHGFYQDMPE